MSERYSKIFFLQGKLYTQGSPVVIMAAALSKDNQSDLLIAQIKLQNISDKIIRVIKAELNLLDSLGRQIDPPITFDYLDLSATRGSEFGQKTPIKITKSETRSFTVKIIEVGFSDGTIWQTNDGNWEQLPQQQAIFDLFGNEVTLNGFKSLFGNEANLSLCEHRDLWCCTCGAINHKGEECCYKCNASLTKLQNLDENELTTEGIFVAACEKANSNDIPKIKKAKEEFAQLKDYKDYSSIIEHCNTKIKKLNKSKKLRWIVAGGAVLLVLLGILGYFVGYPLVSYWSGNYKVYINMYSVEEFEIPEGETSIQDFEFLNCQSIKSITIPDSVTSIGNSAFSGCNNLESITIPNSVTSIGDSAFSGCNSLGSITIPNSVTSIGNYVFYDCYWLTKITIPDSLTSISIGAFSRCSKLASINIPNGVTSIADNAFEDCYSLTSIIIPDSVTSIGKNSFDFCNSLRTVYYGGRASDWAKINIGFFNTKLTQATIYYYSATKPTTEGNYWHYVDSVPTK